MTVGRSEEAQVRPVEVRPVEAPRVAALQVEARQVAALQVEARQVEVQQVAAEAARWAAHPALSAGRGRAIVTSPSSATAAGSAPLTG